MTDVPPACPRVADSRVRPTPVPQPQPIFLVGSLRSGVSILFASLAQHPTVTPIMESGWVTSLAAGLQHAYAEGVHRRATSQLDVMGIELEEFYAHFGKAVDGLIRHGARLDHRLPPALRGGPVPSPDVDARSTGRDTRPSTRWLDATPGACFHLVGLARLFPEAKFIHVVRDAQSVVRTLTDESLRPVYRSQFQQFTEEEAYKHWLECVRACIEAEQAFGSDTILRVHRDDLVDSPEDTLRACLRFLALPFDPACLRPFR